MTTTSRPGTTRTGPIVPAERRTRQWLLLAHLVGAGGWIGVDVVLALFVLVALTTGDPTRRPWRPRPWRCSRSGRCSP